MFPVPIAFWNALLPASITPSVGTLAFTRSAPNIITGRAFFLSSGSLAITGQAPIVTVGIANIARTPSAGTLTITRTAPTIDIGGDQFITPLVRSLAFTRSAPTVTVTAPLTFVFNGTLANSSGNNPFTYTVVSAIPAGRLAVLLLATRSNAAVTSVSDNRGNIYTIDATNFNSGHFVSGGIARSLLTTGLSPGDTITITTGGAIQGAAAIVGSVISAQASPFDRAASAVGISATPTVSTSATTNAHDIVFGLITNNNTPVNQSPGYTTIASAVVFSSNTNRLVGGYKVVSSTGVQTYSPSQGGVSDNWVACIAAYKGT